jgi:hypothetical protein
VIPGHDTWDAAWTGEEEEEEEEEDGNTEGFHLEIVGIVGMVGVGAILSKLPSALCSLLSALCSLHSP